VEHDHLIRCGGAALDASLTKGRKKAPLALNLWGSRPNVMLKISDISEKMCANLPEALVDLIEIATYVYCADQAITRGGDGVVNYGAGWRRNLRFAVPVRCLSLWTQREVQDALVDTLGFLSDDEYSFDFSQLSDPPSVSMYLEFQGSPEESFQAEEVVLFSGGLDSLSGAVQEIQGHKKRIALVSHRAVPKIYKRQRVLLDEIRKICPSSLKPLHVPVWINKDESLGREYTQRSRSFLYACLAVTVAKLFGLQRIRFYENGVVSLNLPISAQVIGARATRSTHPKVLRGFERLFSLILGSNFHVENPFEWKTKADVVTLLRQNGAAELIKHSISCTRTFAITKLHTHCGNCSQCIDRRFGILAANAVQDDPDEMYKVDVLTGKREPGESKTLIESYVRTAYEIAKLDDQTFLQRFPEINRALRYMSGTSDEVASRILELHQRHATEVESVIDAAIKEHSKDFLHGTLPDSCLLSMVGRQEHLKDPWQNYAIELASILGKGLPVAYQGKAGPKDEKDLQAKAQACLISAGEKLNREYPMFQYGVVGTKPDFSTKDNTLFVELKNMGSKARVNKIVDEMVADAVKYTDADAHVLFVVYDPKRCIADDDAFIEALEKHAGVMVRLVR
jgi:hypothetical protein